MCYITHSITRYAYFQALLETVGQATNDESDMLC